MGDTVYLAGLILVASVATYLILHPQIDDNFFERACLSFVALGSFAEIYNVVHQRDWAHYPQTITIACALLSLSPMIRRSHSTRHGRDA